MVHSGVDEWPGGFPDGIVTRAPTVEELMSIASHFGFTSRRMGSAYTRNDLTCMLGGTYWKRGKQTLEKYSRGKKIKDRYCEKYFPV